MHKARIRAARRSGLAWTAGRDREAGPRRVSPAGRGVIYIATGAAHVAAARRSAASVRRTNPGLGIAIFSDLAEAGPEFDRVEPIPNPHVRSKVDHLRQHALRRDALSRHRHPGAGRSFRHVPPARAVRAGGGASGARPAARVRRRPRGAARRLPRARGRGPALSRRAAGAGVPRQPGAGPMPRPGFVADQISFREVLWRVGLARSPCCRKRFNTRRYTWINHWFAARAAAGDPAHQPLPSHQGRRAQGLPVPAVQPDPVSRRRRRCGSPLAIGRTPGYHRRVAGGRSRGGMRRQPLERTGPDPARSRGGGAAARLCGGAGDPRIRQRRLDAGRGRAAGADGALGRERSGLGAHGRGRGRAGAARGRRRGAPHRHRPGAPLGGADVAGAGAHLPPLSAGDLERPRLPPPRRGADRRPLPPRPASSPPRSRSSGR